MNSTSVKVETSTSTTKDGVVSTETFVTVDGWRLRLSSSPTLRALWLSADRADSTVAPILEHGAGAPTVFLPTLWSTPIRVQDDATPPHGVERPVLVAQELP